MIRGPELEILLPRHPGMPFAEGLHKAEQESRVIASNARLETVLTGRGWERFKSACPMWSGTIAAYVQPGRTFGEEAEKLNEVDGRRYIVYTDPGTKDRWLFLIPEKYLDAKDAVLIAEHPCYSSAKEIIIDSGIEMLANFPARNDWFLIDKTHGIPIGIPTDGYATIERFSDTSHNLETRFLYRLEKRIGPVARGFFTNDPHGNMRGIYMNVWPSAVYGMVVEAERKEAA